MFLLYIVNGLSKCKDLKFKIKTRIKKNRNEIIEYNY